MPIKFFGQTSFVQNGENRWKLAGRDTLGMVLGVTTQMVNILTEQNVQASIATLTPSDLLLTPPLGKLTSADFEKAPELVKIGLDHARSVSEALKRFSTDAAGYAQWQASRGMNAQAEGGATTSATTGREPSGITRPTLATTSPSGPSIWPPSALSSKNV